MSNLPIHQQRWELSGAGMENLALTEREIPCPKADELLVRIDACGVCFSDIKILNLGPDHPRLQGRDLRREPVVMGHETAMTVVEVGEALRQRYQVGQRFLIQADVYFQGQGMAFGYRLPGGYSQYQIIPHQVLEGDEGCYLLPVTEQVSDAQAALSEPWACVEAAYAYHPRRAPKPGGRSLVFLLETDEITDAVDELRRLESPVVFTAVHHPWIHGGEEMAAGLAELRRDYPDGFDDILFYGVPGATLAEAAADLLRPGGVYAIQGRGRTGPVLVDIGSIHYRDHWYTGSPEGDVYLWDRGTELRAGGTAWFIGAGGPLGQMHVQRALSLPQPPRRIICSQNGGPRLEELARRFSAPAARAGVELVLLDSKELGDAIYEHVRELTGGIGCDDIVVIIPNAQVVEHAFAQLAPGGGLNVFAGVAVGTKARLDLGRVATEGLRLWGTSGSKISDLQAIVEKVEGNQLPTDRIVAAVGGIEAVKEGLAAVRDGVYPGKTVIYPHCADLPLTPVDELAEQHPSLKAKLLEGRYWTPEAEQELQRLYSAG